MNAFDEVIGYAAEKEELLRIADVLKNTGSYRELGVKTPRGLMLHGEPGVGKTLMANCLIRESGRRAFLCRKDKPNGDFIKEIAGTFRKAKEAAPSIVFLDDLDKFANGDERLRDAEEYVTVQSCIDEVKEDDVFVLATANSLRALPGSLLRAGRFDRSIRLPVPKGKDAVKIIEHYLSEKKTVDVDPETVSKIMEGRSCAELETVINEAGIFAGYRRAKSITMEDFIEACLRTVFDLREPSEEGEEESENRCFSGAARDRILYHEAGHAVLSELLCPGSVSLVSAPKGTRDGFTAYCEPGTLPPIKWKEARIIAALGGMAAVELKFGCADAGNRKDLEQAFDLARDLAALNCVNGFRYFDSPFHRCSDRLLSGLEEVSAGEIDRYYRRAKEILAENAAFLEAVVSGLNEKRYLTAEDLKKIQTACGSRRAG